MGDQEDSRRVVADFKGRFTLILGEVNSGKTRLTRRILEAFLEAGEGSILVVDLSPRPQSDRGQEDLHGVGGRLLAERPPGLTVLETVLYAPRLESRDEDSARKLAKENAGRIQELLQRAEAMRPCALFVNDASMYLQAGDGRRFHAWVRSAPTAVVNAYLGRSLGSGALSRREREAVLKLMEQADRRILLGGGGPGGTRNEGDFREGDPKI